MTKKSNYNEENLSGHEIRITDMVPGGEYANAMQVDHNRDELQMIFFNIFGASGKVVSKIITSPGHFKKIIAAMIDNLKKYEEKFGKVEESKGLDKKLNIRK